MVTIETGLPPLTSQALSLYYAKDPLLGNLPIVVFHGPSTTTNSTHNSSRIQAHVFSIAGYQNFPRLTKAPNSPLYAAVHLLPEDQQGDELFRGLAISVSKYFSEISNIVKKCLLDEFGGERPGRRASRLFDDAHAASLASQMVPLENSSAVASCLVSALSQKSLSWTDVDVVLPRNSITKLDPLDNLRESQGKDIAVDSGRPSIDYGKFAEIVDLFGSPAFLPTSRIRRGPSKPTAWNKSLDLSQDQTRSRHRDMRELLDTEKSYVIKISELKQIIGSEHQRKANHGQAAIPSSRSAAQQLFPKSLEEIFEINSAFLERLRSLMNDEDLRFSKVAFAETDWVTGQDQTGSDSFARLFLDFLPRFKGPYQEYLRIHSQSLRMLSEIMREGTSVIARALQPIGEQRVRGYLIEPVQRLPRYSLLIDNMVNQLPAAHPALSKLLKAKDLIADICALDEDEPIGKPKVVQILKSLVADWPEQLTPEGRLITAIDVTELKAPYSLNASSSNDSTSMLLLFPDLVLILQKSDGNTLSARGLLAEIDRPGPASLGRSISGASGAVQRPLSVAHNYRLRETWFTESDEGRLITFSRVRRARGENFEPKGSLTNSTSVRVYGLHGAYEGKASRLSEEIARARIEHRFPERMREDERWSLRVISPQNDMLGIVSAIFENDLQAERGIQRRSCGRIKVSVRGAGDDDFGNRSWDDRSTDIEIKAQITLLEAHKFRLEFLGDKDTTSVDDVWAEDFVAVFIQRCKLMAPFPIPDIQSTYQPKPK